ncbi:unnamed protein product [Alternaria alternata]
MAIHSDYPGLTVQIICGGKPIEEHVNEEDEERDEPKTTTRYVECQSNTEFAIKTTFRPPFAPLDLAIHVHLDGIKVNGLIVHKHQMLNETYVKSATKWKEGQKWRASKFVFSDLNVVQEDSETLAEKNMDALSQVGTISVVITPILSMLKERRPKGRKRELKEFGMISEETVKGDAETASITPGLLQQSPTPINQRMQSGLTKKDILVLIKHYRGSSAGLEGLPEKDLAILFSSYRGDKPNETPINQEPVLSESRARIKRELVGDSVARGQGKKRKVEIIVLDD